ncbi:MAG: antibiotic biosynthesis monooxygenase [Candidatus Zixiibacteriota bacterium]
MMNRMTVPPEFREKFEHAFATRAKAVDRRPGFIRAEILRPTSGDEYIVMTHWESEAAFEGWTKSPEYAEGHRRVDEFRDGDGRMALTSKVEKYEVFAG